MRGRTDHENASLARCMAGDFGFFTLANGWALRKFGQGTQTCAGAAQVRCIW
jgi:hypothetical protein